MLLAGLNFTNLSVEGYASFILALIFTIITIAAAIYVARHKNLNTIAAVVLILIVPMVAILCWVYLLFTVLKQPLVNLLCISFACAIGYGLIALAIGYFASLAKSKKQANKNEQVKQNKNVAENVEKTPALTFVSVENKENATKTEDKNNTANK